MNGYELVRLQENQVKKTGDTMTGNLTMAGGAEVDGNATSSTKLKNARTFTIGNAQPKTFDGTQDLTWTLQEIGAGTGGTNATYKTTVNANQWQVNGANYKFLVTHNLNANIIHVGGIHATTNESILVPYKIINNNSLEVFTVDNTLSINITVISEALAAGGGGGGGGNFLPLTGGTVTGLTNFNAGIKNTANTWSINNTGDATFNAIHAKATSVFQGIRSEGISPATSFANWSISKDGFATFATIENNGNALLKGETTLHNTIRGLRADGGEAWRADRDGNASFESLRVRTTGSFFEIQSTQGRNVWSINDSGDTNLKSLTVAGNMNVSGSSTFGNVATFRNWIYGMDNIALGRGQVYINQQAVGNVTSNYLKMGNMIMASLDNNAGVYFSSVAGDAPHIYFGNNIKVGRGQLKLPHAGGTIATTDYMRIGGANIAGVDSGNVHICTNDGRFNALYVSNIINTYSLNRPITMSNTSALDEINSVNVIETSEGFRMAKTTRNDSKVVVETKVNDDGEDLVSIDSVSAISTLWKANQELISKIESLQEEVEKLKGGN